MTKKIIPILLFSLMFFYINAQETKSGENEKQNYTSVNQSNDSLKIDTVIIKKLSIIEEFKEARKHNKQNLKKISKFYNPLTFIFHLFGI